MKNRIIRKITRKQYARNRAEVKTSCPEEAFPALPDGFEPCAPNGRDHRSGFDEHRGLMVEVTKDLNGSFRFRLYQLIEDMEFYWLDDFNNIEGFLRFLDIPEIDSNPDPSR
jgi:hypothetical protein